MGTLALATWPLAVLGLGRVFREAGRRFWLAMTALTAVQGTVAVLLRGTARWGWRLPPATLAWAAASAVVLYGLFYLGDRALLALLPSLPAAGGVVYEKAESGRFRLVIAGALLLVIGPGEELYWRGLVQAHLALWLGPACAVLVAAGLYAAAHLVTRNPALVLAALLCGVYWGALYWATGNLAAVVVSHALWDCLTLLWLPLPVGRTAASGRRAGARLIRREFREEARPRGRHGHQETRSAGAGLVRRW